MTGWIIIGGLAGWIGSKIMQTDDQMSILRIIVVGMVGGLLGGFLLRLPGVDVAGGGLIFSFVTCLLGTLVLLAPVRPVTRDHVTSSPQPESPTGVAPFGYTRESTHAIRGRTLSSNEKLAVDPTNRGTRIRPVVGPPPPVAPVP